LRAICPLAAAALDRLIGGIPHQSVLEAVNRLAVRHGGTQLRLLELGERGFNEPSSRPTACNKR
jgi:hypothetical protein